MGYHWGRFGELRKIKKIREKIYNLIYIYSNIYNLNYDIIYHQLIYNK